MIPDDLEVNFGSRRQFTEWVKIGKYSPQKQLNIC